MASWFGRSSSCSIPVRRIAGNVYIFTATSRPGPPSFKSGVGAVSLRLPQGVKFNSPPAVIYRSGAGKWRQFWTITLPLIWDIMAVSIVFLIIGGMKAFEIIWLLTDQRPQTDTHVIATRMVQTMFEEFNVGEATALAVLLFLMVFVGSTATMRGLQREAVQA